MRPATWQSTLPRSLPTLASLAPLAARACLVDILAQRAFSWLLRQCANRARAEWQSCTR